MVGLIIPLLPCLHRLSLHLRRNRRPENVYVFPNVPPCLNVEDFVVRLSLAIVVFSCCLVLFVWWMTLRPGLNGGADGRWHGGGPTEVLLCFVTLQHFSFLLLYVDTEFDDVVFCFWRVFLFRVNLNPAAFFWFNLFSLFTSEAMEPCLYLEQS